MTPILGQLQTSSPIKPALGDHDCSGLMEIMGLKKPSSNDPTIATSLKNLKPSNSWTPSLIQ
jgi:hypothetical protein